MSFLSAQKKAFTLIELMIVITIMAILTMALVFSFGRATLKAKFDDQKMQIINITEEARSRSLSNMLLSGGEETNYYALVIGELTVTLTAYGETQTEIIDAFNFAEGFSTETLTAYYFPPYGEVCFELDSDSNCLDGATERSTVLEDSTGIYSAVVSIDAYSGYASVE
ncbi:MAG: type II secretion system protein [Candidatus Gracilibacteria bacterium]